MGSTPLEFDTSTLVGLPCYVRIEERPWKENKTWMGVTEVLPHSEEAETDSFDNTPMNKHSSNSIEDMLNNISKNTSSGNESKNIFAPEINTPKL